MSISSIVCSCRKCGVRKRREVLFIVLDHRATWCKECNFVTVASNGTSVMMKSEVVLYKVNGKPVTIRY